MEKTQKVAPSFFWEMFFSVTSVHLIRLNQRKHKGTGTTENTQTFDGQKRSKQSPHFLKIIVSERGHPCRS